MQGTDRTMLTLLAWIVWGVLVFGTLGWVATVFVVSSVPASAGVIAGGAAGGGFGAVVRLLVFSEVEDTTETVTFDTGADDPPGPEPVDLFEAHPDPLVYYDSTDEKPIALASNPAFSDHFDNATTTEETPLASALVGADTDPVVAAAASGERLSVDQTVTDTADESVSDEGGARAFRVRVVPVDNRGYIHYTPLSDDREENSESQNS